MSDPKHPQPGDLIIDASDVNPVDNPKGAVHKYRKIRAGYKTAVTTILNLPAALLSRAGIDPARVTKLVNASTDYDRIQALTPAVLKLAEILKETGQARADVISLIIEEVATTTRVRAKSDPNKNELLGAVEPVLVYQSAAATKAVKTKIKTGKLKPKAPKHPKPKKGGPPPEPPPVVPPPAVPPKA